MEYRQLGQYGVRVSPICLGTAFRSFWAGDTDEKTCARIIEKAVDLGINFIDCANYYFSGRCEEIVGKVLSHMKSRRDDLVITSKVWSNIGKLPLATRKFDDLYTRANWGSGISGIFCARFHRILDAPA